MLRWASHTGIRFVSSGFRKHQRQLSNDRVHALSNVRLELFDVRRYANTDFHISKTHYKAGKTHEYTSSVSVFVSS